MAKVAMYLLILSLDLVGFTVKSHFCVYEILFFIYQNDDCEQQCEHWCQCGCHTKVTV